MYEFKARWCLLSRNTVTILNVESKHTNASYNLNPINDPILAFYMRVTRAGLCFRLSEQSY